MEEEEERKLRFDLLFGLSASRRAVLALRRRSKTSSDVKRRELAMLAFAVPRLGSFVTVAQLNHPLPAI